MPTQRPNTFWQRCRKLFRRVRMVGWALVFLLILQLLYLNQVGLPEFIKRPVLENLRKRGVVLEFKNLRLSWYRGLVAYDVSFGRAEDKASPQITAKRVLLGLNVERLKHLDFQVGQLAVQNARIAWPLVGTNVFALEKVNAELAFLPGDTWALNNLELVTSNAKLRLSGSITNASALRNWSIFKLLEGTGTNAPSPLAIQTPRRPNTTQRISDALTRTQFKTRPAIRIDFTADALDDQALLISVRARLDEGSLIAQARYTSATGQLDISATSDFDLQKIRPALPPKADNWLARYSWRRPPQLRTIASITLPNPAVDTDNARWQKAFSSLKLDGEVKVGPAAFSGVPFDSMTTRVLYFDSTWRLQNMRITRPEGILMVEHRTEENTRDYYWHLQGVFDPEAVRPLLDPLQQRGLDMVKFTTPPQLDVEMWSRWYERERTGIKGTVSATNFMVRGESVKTFNSSVEYSNLVLHLFAPCVTRGENGEQLAKLSGVTIDFKSQMLYLTNGFSTLDPVALAHVIGKKTTHTLEPYQFANPPTAHVNGSVNVVNSKISDLHIDLSGGPFHWWKFNLPYISGNIAWSNQSLLLTNVAGQFYGGQMEGFAAFDFTPAVGDDFQFAFAFTNADLATLLPDLGGKTNQLSGRIAGLLSVTNANTKDMHSWQGSGNLELKEGLLWEIPLFGFFAPVLNSMYSNLGSGRATDGSATYTISNSVITTDNLRLVSPAMRMQYRGSVDFDGQLDARAEAELLRNTAVIGPVVSTMLWPVSKLMEYKVTGTLGHPVAEPVHIPKALLFPLHPFQSIKNLFSSPADTNAPPKLAPIKTAE